MAAEARDIVREFVVARVLRLPASRMQPPVRAIRYYTSTSMSDDRVKQGAVIRPPATDIEAIVLQQVMRR
jgi:hypothetical protein